MWLFTRIGFFSVVQHKDDPARMLVRARFRDDLERLLAFGGCDAEEIDSETGTDYAHRVFLPRATWNALAARLMEDIDYPNFKAAAHSADPVRNAALFDVWSVMRRAQDRADV